jgi:TetR/AcrR family transcriptional regulator, transcriptional repressor for nem operon
MTDITIRDRILDAAEIRARRGGYGGFSFREIAADVGVKSSSVHYHFPTKADLGQSLVKRYTQRAAAFLGTPEESSPLQAVERVTQLFRDALIKDDKMCLCGLFGAERDALPVEVAAATAEFFRLVISYLTQALGTEWNGDRPTAILARLEGALIVARTLGDPSVFEDSLRSLGF